MMKLQEKWHALQTGENPRVLDLFAGCGGFSLGLQRVGWEIVGGLEKEPERAHTYAHNLHKHESVDRRALHAKPRDITQTDPHALLKELDPKPERGIDVIVGGPPCQAYARVGRAKLREINDHPEAFLQDARGQLHAAYVRYVKELQPLIVIMENVPEILNYGGENVGEIVATQLEALGYVVRYTLLNAAWYGVPQTRDRFFLVAYHQCMNQTPKFPPPTHAHELPPGYRGTRAHALKLVPKHDQQSLFGQPSAGAARITPTSTSHFLEVLPSPSLQQKAVTCEDALGDLRPLDPDQTKRGIRRMEERQGYLLDANTDFRRHMRRWPRFEGSPEGVTAHVCRSNNKDKHIFAAMPPGADYPKAHAIAKLLFQQEVARCERAGKPLKEGSPAWDALYKKLVPCYDPSKYANKWRKLEADAPSRTLMSHLSHDCYSHIHPDSTQARTITVREAARLQSFPDGFEFPCSMVQAFGQVGNAVPPLLAYALGREVEKV